MKRINNCLRAALLLLCLGCSGLSAASEWNIAQLMQALASHQSGRATFTETTYLAILKRPVESAGELTFVAPDYLQKITLTPQREVLTLRGDTLSIERKARKRVLRLSEYPQLRALVDSICGALAGAHATLANTYQLTLTGAENNWQLTLIPKIVAADGVGQIVISGSAGIVSGIEINQVDGDRSIMRIENLQLDQPLFGAPAP
jgi:outer membrane lipoprotein-sorting protein